VPAIDVTALYKDRRSVHLRIVDAAGSPATAGVTLRLGGHLVAAGSGKSSYDFMLAGGLTYDAELVGAEKVGDGKKHAAKISPAKDGNDPVELKLP
jgi:hypothetical protein